MATDFTEITRLATLANKSLTGRQWTNFQRDLEIVGSLNRGLILFASRILTNVPVEIEMLGNNPQPPDLLERYRALAQHLGASVKEINEGPFSTSMVFFPHPPARH